MDRTGVNFFAGLVIGGLVGSALALLMAPQPGEETRAQIRDRSLELGDQVEGRVAETRATVDETIRDLRHQIEDAQKKISQLQEQSREAIAERADKVKRSVR